MGHEEQVVKQMVNLGAEYYVYHFTLSLEILLLQKEHSLLWYFDSLHTIGSPNSINFCFLLLVVVARSLPFDGGMAEDHGAQEAGQLSRPGPKVVERQRVAKE